MSIEYVVTARHLIYLALVHYPVRNKNGETVTSAITNLDIHDIARAARTYDVSGYFIVTPVVDQQALVQKIVDHWTHGYGGRYNPKRREALALVRVAESMEAAKSDIVLETGRIPKVVTTSAQETVSPLRFEELRRFVAGGTPLLIVFGTAWGLSAEVHEAADGILEPITGTGGYNHLSVRSAATVVLDRLQRA